MKRILLLVVFACLARADDNLILPTPLRVVTDGAGVLSSDDVKQLEEKIGALQKAGLAQVVIYIAPALPDGANMEALTLASVNAWGVGDAETDNGLTIFAFMKERKIRIEVGLGLEKRITNDVAKSLIQDQIAPAFREGKHAEGLLAALDRIATLLGDPE